MDRVWAHYRQIVIGLKLDQSSASISIHEFSRKFVRVRQCICIWRRGKVNYDYGQLSRAHGENHSQLLWQVAITHEVSNETERREQLSLVSHTQHIAFRLPRRQCSRISRNTTCIHKMRYPNTDPNTIPLFINLRTEKLSDQFSIRTIWFTFILRLRLAAWNTSARTNQSTAPHSAGQGRVCSTMDYSHYTIKKS